MQMMVISVINMLKAGVGKVSALAFGCHHFAINAFLGDVVRQFSLENIFEKVGEYLDGIASILNSWLYLVARLIFQFVDFIQYLVYKIAGISLSDKISFDLPIFRLLLTDTVLKIFLTMFILGLMIIIILAIIAIIKSEYKNATGGNKDGKIVNSSAEVAKKSLMSLFLMVFVPFLMVVGIAFGSVFLSSINSALNADGTSSTTIGGQLFVASSYNANRYRLYAESNERIPILYSFQDPYANGSYKYYTEEELEAIFNSWSNGGDIYRKMQNGDYDAFNDTLVYNNGLVLNKKSSYGDFENFISTVEQYYVMADFIDYAVKNNLEFYIKDSTDKDIDWTCASSTAKLTDFVYDQETGALHINYKDTNNLSGYGADSYTLVLAPAGFNASSPIEDSINTISELVNILLDNTKTLDAEEKLFKLLERTSDSTNIVKWKTEEIQFNEDVFPVYYLTKKYLNTRTGAVESRAKIEVARKETAGTFYILNKTEDGTYTYTNQTIDYYNDGKIYLDTLEPIYVYGSWPEKLYNDMQVIYKDINIDNYINYDTWADSLGKYFSTNAEINSDDVTQFATTLIHPLGLIMSELFLGVTFEDEQNVLVTDYGFTSKYSKDLIRSICYAVSGEVRYSQLENEIDTFISLFNGLFAPVMEDLQHIEGFDMNGDGEYAVQAYVYKAYLCSIMLSDSGTAFFKELAEEIYQLNNLVNNIAKGSTYYITDSTGRTEYEIEYVLNSDGELIPYVKVFSKAGSETKEYGKYMYNSSGDKVLVADLDGVISSNLSAMYVPKTSAIDYFTRVNEDSACYEILIDGKFYTKSDALKNGKGDTWDKYFIAYFEKYFIIGYDNEFYTNLNFVNLDGKISEEFDNNNQFIYIPKCFEDYRCEINDIEAVYRIVDGYYEIDYDGKTYTHTDKDDNGVTYGGKFETFFEQAKARAYVYMPIDGDTSATTTTVELVRAIKPDNSTEFNTVFTVDTENKVQNATLIENNINLKMSNYFMYESTVSAKLENVYYTYSTLAPKTQAIIDDIINNSSSDTVYYNYIKMYQEGQISVNSDLSFTIDSILSANTITSSEAKEIEGSLSEYIEFASKNRLNSLKKKKIIKKLREYYKYQLIYAFQSYLSTKVQAGFNVTVNGYSYNISQAMSTRGFLELIYGNNLLLDSLETQIKNKTPYKSLTDFNKLAIDNLEMNLHSDLVDINKLIDKLSKDLMLATLSNDADYKYEFSDREVELINNYYYIKNDKRIYYTATDLASFLHDKNIKYIVEIIEQLTYIKNNFGIIFSNYLSGQTLLIGQIENDAQAYEMINRYISIEKSDEVLSYGIGNAYAGIIDQDGVFGYLKQFLKEFGNLCFGLQTKSNFTKLSYDQTDTVDFYSNFTKDGEYKESYAEMLLTTLNEMLGDVDFGSNTNLIQKFDNFYAINNKIIDGETKFSALTDESKYDLYLLYSYYNSIKDKYGDTITQAENAVSYLNKFKNGLYAMQSTSLVYGYITNYLNYFKYNVDVNDVNNSFTEYIYDEYYTTVSDSYVSNADLSYNDKLTYFFTYIEAFDDFKFNSNGNYYSSLNEIQMKIVRDCITFYTIEAQATKNMYDEKYVEAQNLLTALGEFIYSDKTIDECGQIVNINFNLSTLAQENCGILNLYRILNFVGLDFDIDKTLKDYRIDALNYLTDFSEYSGETSASIQSRYLALLYIACADVVENSVGENILNSDENSKQIVLKLAGIENRAEEKLVDLEYEINYDNAVSDEKFGSIFIICVYNDQTAKYEPFIMANKADEHNTPYSEYYASSTGEIVYYPVIAKGIFDASGKPTAIRSSNGNIEFYREEVYSFDIANVDLGVYYVSQEHTATEYSIGETIISNIKKIFSTATITDTISDIISIFKADVSLPLYQGVKTNYVYHLDGGKCNLNYTFNNATGINVVNLYDMSQLNIIILVIASTILLKAMISVLYGVISSMFELAICFAISPAVFSLNSINEKAIGKWKSNFIKRFFTMYGYIVAVNAYFILIILLQKMGNVMPTVSNNSIQVLNQTLLFRYVDVNQIVGFLISTALLLVATTMLNSLSQTFSADLFGSNEAINLGEKTKKAMDSQFQEAKYFISGQEFMDVTVDAVDKAVAIVPGVDGISTFRDAMQKATQYKNKKKADKLYKDMIANGISADVAQQARKTYEDAMNTKINENVSAATAEAGRRKERLGQIFEYKKDDKIKTCKYCHRKYEDNGKVTNCPHCGRKV